MRRRRQATERQQESIRSSTASDEQQYHPHEDDTRDSSGKEEDSHFDNDDYNDVRDEPDYFGWVGIFLLLTSGGFLVWQVVLPKSLEFLTTSTLSIYTIRHALPNVGDKTLRYQLLRMFYDLPGNDQRSLDTVKDLNWRQYRPIQTDIPYNIFNCPSVPPDGYPYAWNVLDLVSHWPPDDITPRDTIHQGLCIFDFKIDYDKALSYRSLELPFVIRGDPQVAQTVERWHQPGYLKHLLGDIPHRTEVANHSHYMYWIHPELSKRRAARSARRLPSINYDPPPGWKPPTDVIKMTYLQWLETVNSTASTTKRDHEYYYFQTVGCGDVPKCEEGATEFLFDELPYFQPPHGLDEENLYLVQAEKQKGIHCRFGMPGLSIAAHFDGTRNTIVVLTGSRRYLLAHPSECPNMGLYPMGHPSARHSGLSWQPNGTNDREGYTQWKEARVNEVVLQAGDVLYLPTHWFHMIVSLDINIQCNTRSGIDGRFTQTIKECGFRQEY